MLRALSSVICLAAAGVFASLSPCAAGQYVNTSTWTISPLPPINGSPTPNDFYNHSWATGAGGAGTANAIGQAYNTPAGNPTPDSACSPGASAAGTLTRDWVPAVHQEGDPPDPATQETITETGSGSVHVRCEAHCSGIAGTSARSNAAGSSSVSVTDPNNPKNNTSRAAAATATPAPPPPPVDDKTDNYTVTARVTHTGSISITGSCAASGGVGRVSVGHSGDWATVTSESTVNLGIQ